MPQDDLKLRLTGLLKDIFQFESEELDFGIYKIMNYKKKEIRKFIDKELIDGIKKQLKSIGEDEKKKKTEKVEEYKIKIKGTFGTEKLPEADFENHNVLFMENNDYIEKIFNI